MENSKQSNRQILDTWQAIIDNKTFDQLETVESEDVENVNPSGTFKGMKEHKQMLEGFAQAFPNYIHDNYNFVEQGEWIAMEGTFSGDFTGQLSMVGKNIPPTNKKVTFPYCGFVKIVNGKVVQNNLYYDSKLFMSQIAPI